MNETAQAHLINKYNISGPRYTSYPTVPYWTDTNFDVAQWIKSFTTCFKQTNQTQGISLYIHLPFCESLCTFCGCHKHITKRHDVELPYIEALLTEWNLYLQQFNEKPNIKAIHIGGGTPTFFSAYHLQYLIKAISKTAQFMPNMECSFEAHPNYTSVEQLQALYEVGFTRCSFGVQDYDATVQHAIHRQQSFKQVQHITQAARSIGYTSVSHDLVFGLPFQTLASMQHTIALTQQLMPDRISFYSYAHVPWIKGVGQRGFDENNLPSPQQKRALYEMGKQALQQAGYDEIGMDHFALPTDDLYTSKQQKTLHRNFMGYTTQTTQLMVGLGMSAISDAWNCFAQNVKTVHEYQQLLQQQQWPIVKGYQLTTEDQILRKHILNLMCKFTTNWHSPSTYTPFLDTVLDRLYTMEQDGLVELSEQAVRVTDAGIPFVRNVCMAFDKKWVNDTQTQQKFSKTI